MNKILYPCNKIHQMTTFFVVAGLIVVFLMFLLKLSFNMRMKAIRLSAFVLNSNPFSGPFSLNEIEHAKKNRKMNQGWFIRNYFKLKTKLSNDEFKQLAENLGLGFSELMEIERLLSNSKK